MTTVVSRWYPAAIAYLLDPARTASVTVEAMALNHAPVWDPTHSSVASVLAAGGVEVSASGYARQTVNNFTFAVDEGQIESAADDIVFTINESGISVPGVLSYLAIGGNDGTRIPMELMGGQFRAVCSAPAGQGAAEVWVERLTGAIPLGTSITFSNSTTATLTAGAGSGERRLSVNPLPAPIVPGETADWTPTGDVFPWLSDGSSTLTVQMAAAESLVAG